MEILLIILLFALLIAIYDLLRKANVINARQTREIRKLHDSLIEHMEKNKKS